ncbi:DUF3617 domain-containing protein [Rhizorhabdus dicambivorans]|uniref:DUF3617 domain-containing protein n=1 Tax=Rhizorhabdus dicambivorans TaxID=1850238 RepID=A0A2A4FTA8_9SPHN|nr:hypothetical protein [Rhizorhabdus dicambivorans]ATE64298.1 hypothetical protein CMV14_07720 [Rhizorhabdus dicambivorans]PCE40936.1 hypothetical protein COO09_18070 [Rhizorhabdus dicambivorans]
MATWLRGGMAVLVVLAVRAAAAPAPAPAPVPGSAPAPGAAPVAAMSLAALGQMESGLWQLDVQGRAPRQICISDPVALVQIEHDQAGCSRFVIANDPKSATVHYSCQRAGWGRTTVRVETPRAAVIQTQGIARNAPFDYVVQARRVGSCTAQAAAKQR